MEPQLRYHLECRKREVENMNCDESVAGEGKNLRKKSVDRIAERERVCNLDDLGG